MKFQRILSALYNTPLHLTTDGFEMIDGVLRTRLTEARSQESEARIVRAEATDIWGNKLPAMEIVEGVAVIPIVGPLMQHASLLDKQCGACSYQDIVANVRAARQQRVRGILLNFDSPGGEMCGCIEAAREIAKVQEAGDVPIYAFTDATLASAAYFLASGCTGIFATQSASIGSIGCIIGFLDVSQAFATMGYKAEYIVSGPLKGTGARGTSLSDEQRAYLQERVDHCADQFKTFVNSWREDVPESAMQGQMFFGDDAEELGLIDGVVEDMEAVLEMFDEE